jgi:LysM repeat protein
MWRKATIWIDALFFGPFSAVAIYAYVKGREWIRLPSIIWGSVLMTNVFIIMCEETWGPHATSHWLPALLDDLAANLRRDYDAQVRTLALDLAAPGRFTVRAGDMAWKIATNFRMTLTSLRALNPEVSSWNDLRIGQVLMVSRGPEPFLSGGRSYQTYAVMPGDTLWKIADRAFASVSVLMNKNNLTDSTGAWPDAARRRLVVTHGTGGRLILRLIARGDILACRVMMHLTMRVASYGFTGALPRRSPETQRS